VNLSLVARTIGLQYLCRIVNDDRLRVSGVDGVVLVNDLSGLLNAVVLCPVVVAMDLE